MDGPMTSAVAGHANSCQMRLTREKGEIMQNSTVFARGSMSRFAFFLLASLASPAYLAS